MIPIEISGELPGSFVRIIQQQCSFQETCICWVMFSLTVPVATMGNRVFNGLRRLV